MAYVWFAIPSFSLPLSALSCLSFSVSFCKPFSLFYPSPYLLSPPIVLVIIFFPECVLSFSITPLPLLLSLFTLSSSLPGCRVMYGPCQRWNQWEAGCFNLAWEPSGSRSSASWKSDGSGLSLLCLYSPPSVLPHSPHWSTLSSRRTKHRGRRHHLKALENNWAHLLSVNTLWTRIRANRWGASQFEMPEALKAC